MTYEGRISKVYHDIAIIAHPIAPAKYAQGCPKAEGANTVCLKSAQRRTYELIKSSRYLIYLNTTFYPRFKYALAYCRLEHDLFSATATALIDAKIRSDKISGGI
jgi:hypothetical protein